MLSKKKFLFIAITWTLIVTYLSLATLNTSIESAIKIPYKDKVVHFVFYFLFVILWMLTINNKRYLNKNGFKIVVLAIIYGILMELCQAFLVSNRTADVNDVFANSTGALVGLLSIKIYLQNKTH